MSFISYILKLKVSLIQEESVGLLVEAEKKIWQTVVVDVSDGNSSSIEEISKCVRVEFFRILDRVSRNNPCFTGRQKRKKFAVGRLTETCCEQDSNHE